MEVIRPGQPAKTIGAEPRNAIILAASKTADFTELRGLVIRLLRASTPDAKSQSLLWQEVAQYEKLREEWSTLSANTKSEELNSALSELAERAAKGPLPSSLDAALALAIVLKIRADQATESLQGRTALRLDQDVECPLFFAVAVPRSEGTAFGEVRLKEEDGAALVLYPGSSIARLLLRGTVQFAEFAAALISRARSPDAAARDIMERLRAQHAPTAYPLIRLDDKDSAQNLAKRQGVIIFLHGLLSTDLGTFDGFINRWLNPKPSDLPAMDSSQLFAKALSGKALQAIKTSVALVGWPHDTLTKINVNAQDLVDLIVSRLGATDSRIAFVCHSRGGLLARAVAEKLFDKDPIWQTRICGATTFGTPHDGADFAEHPDVGMGAFLLASLGTKSPFGIIDALAYAKQRDSLEGIRDLRPRSAPGSNFIYDLQEKESHSCSYGPRRLPVTAIGGNYHSADPNETLLRRMARRYISAYTGQEEHDIVVTLASATAAHTTDGPPGRTTCDHFTYFTEAESNSPHVGAAIARLWTCFDLKQTIGPLIAEPNFAGTIVQEKTKVTIGGVSLDKKP